MWLHVIRHPKIPETDRDALEVCDKDMIDFFFHFENRYRKKCTKSKKKCRRNIDELQIKLKKVNRVKGYGLLKKKKKN